MLKKSKPVSIALIWLILAPAVLLIGSIFLISYSNANERIQSPNNKMDEEQEMAYAKTALAERLTININEIQSAHLKKVTWRSSATGCPQPGRQYMQVMVPGVLITLEVDGVRYRYHANISGRPFYCPAEQAETPGPSQDGELE